MKNVKYERVYPYMHNHSTEIYSLLQGLSLLDSQWMKNWKARAGDNQFLYKTTVKADSKFKCFQGNIVTTM
jgi:hypothetical protein